MEIKIRGKIYKAEHLTSINNTALYHLLIDEEGKYIIDTNLDINSLSPEKQVLATEKLINKLKNPQILSEIAYSISAIFPSIPSDLVSYEVNGKFKMNLEIDELFAIIRQTTLALREKKYDFGANEESLLKEAEVTQLTLPALPVYKPLTGQEDEQEKELNRLRNIANILTPIKETEEIDYAGLLAKIKFLEDDLNEKNWFGITRL